MNYAEEWGPLLRENAAAYARVALTNIGREFPNGAYYTMSAPGDIPNRPMDRNPVFYGSYDWHSCVEMHWLLVRLLRAAADDVNADEIRAGLDRQFTKAGLGAEAEFVAGGGGTGVYGLGWVLTLVHETGSFDDADAARWSSALRPLAEAAAERLMSWLSKATYPIRYGLHPNTAFALTRSLAHARDLAAAGDPALADAISAAASRWFAADTDYPGRYEPSGSDFLSPALTEAELMAQMLSAQEFADWLSSFLPGLADRQPESLFSPAVVSDSSDGQIAHLHGLNASRAWCWRQIADRLPPGDARIDVTADAMRRHAEAALAHVVGDDYMVEHWLAAYAVLLLS